jgi:hypothetical protein
MFRLSKEAREMIDTGKVKTVCREETDERTTSSSVQREKRRIARQKERRATLILGQDIAIGKISERKSSLYYMRRNT